MARTAFSTCKDSKVICEEKTCLMDQSVVEAVNDQSSFLGWRATNYSQFWGRSLDDGNLLRLGTVDSSRTRQKMHPIYRGGRIEDLPRELDARQKWPGLISGVHDQGWCGASWAISTADVASDRFGIMSKGEDKVQLSAQQLLSCNDRYQKGCLGGHVDRAWIFVRKNGYGLMRINERSLGYDFVSK